MINQLKSWLGMTPAVAPLPRSGKQGGRAYEGASSGYRMKHKGLGGGGPNISTAFALPNLRDRSRHAVRNNPYATKAVEAYVSNLVGSGIKAKWPDAVLQSHWEQWVADCDYDDDESFHGLQALVARGQFEAGEILTRFRVRRKGAGLRVPLQLQVIEADHLDIAYSETFNPNKVIRNGIEFNRAGKKSRYHLWQQHPADFGGANTRVGIKADDMLHVYRKLRAGQLRGIPELSAILVRLYEIDEMQDATLVRQKTAALFGWIVRKRDAGEQYLPGAPTGTITPDGSPVEEGEEREVITEIKPGGVHYLEDDEDITFSEPADIAGIYVDYLKSELHAVAAGGGLTYEQLTGDLAGVNYSSIRAGLIEFRRRIEFLQLTLLIHKFCQPVAAKWLRVAVITGVAPAHITLDNYSQYLPEWRPPKWDWVDPLKDVQGDLLEIQAGLATLRSKQLERGLDPEETIEQLKLEQALEGLTLLSNPAKVTKAGQVQEGKV